MKSASADLRLPPTSVTTGGSVPPRMAVLVGGLCGFTSLVATEVRFARASQLKRAGTWNGVLVTARLRSHLGTDYPDDVSRFGVPCVRDSPRGQVALVSVLLETHARCARSRRGASPTRQAGNSSSRTWGGTGELEAATVWKAVRSLLPGSSSRRVG